MSQGGEISPHSSDASALSHVQSITMRAFSDAISSMSRSMTEASEMLTSFPSLCDTTFIPKSQLIFVRSIGSGSFGRVYKGILYDQDVAIKELTVKNFVDALGESASFCSDAGDEECIDDPNANATRIAETLLALEREVAVLRHLSFPKVVMFLGVCIEPPCIITEYCARGSLYDVLAKARERPELAKRLTWNRRVSMALDAAKGMNFLHSRLPPVLHRDLKSPNLLVDEHWACKVADFNTSRFIDPSYVTASITATNPRWLAPEVLRENNHSKASDVYPFGIVLWELMTWQEPWDHPWEKEGISTFAILDSVVHKGRRPELPRDLNDLPGEKLPDTPEYSTFFDDYISLMQDCWAEDPAKRPSFSDIVQRLCKLKEIVSGNANQNKSAKVQRPTVTDPPVSPSLKNKVVTPFERPPPPEVPVPKQPPPSCKPLTIDDVSPFSSGPSGLTKEQLAIVSEVTADEDRPIETGPPSFGVWAKPQQKPAKNSNPDVGEIRNRGLPPNMFQSMVTPIKEGSEESGGKLVRTGSKGLERWAKLREIFGVEEWTEKPGLSQNWEMLRTMLMGEEDGSLNGSSELSQSTDSPPVPSQEHKPKTVRKSKKPGSKWNKVRDLLMTSSSMKEEKEYSQGWQLIKAILKVDEGSDQGQDDYAETVVENPDDEESYPNPSPGSVKKSKWEVVKHLMVSEEAPAEHPGWGLIKSILTQSAGAQSIQSLTPISEAGSADLGGGSVKGNVEKLERSASSKRWAKLRNVLLGDKPTAKAQPFHPGWQVIKQVLGTEEVDSAASSPPISRQSSQSSSASNQGVAAQQILKRIPTNAERKWEFLRHMLRNEESSLLVRHWDFLKTLLSDEHKKREDAGKSTGEASSKPPATLPRSRASKRWKKVRELLIVDYDPPSAEKWRFLREWLIRDDDLGVDWNELREFAKQSPEVPTGDDWEYFRKLFFEDRCVRSHPHWGFLKDLLVKDASATNVLPDESMHMLEASGLKEGKMRDILLEKQKTPTKSKWSMVRTLLMDPEPAPSMEGVRQYAFETEDPPEKSKWDEILNILTN